MVVPVDEMKECEKRIDLDFTNQDISAETASNYFQSSFARSMAFQTSNQCKSLDSGYVRTDYEEGETYCDYMPGCNPVFANVSKSANVSSVKSFAESFRNKATSSNKYIQVLQNKQVDNSVADKTENKDQTSQNEILKLKAECQSLAEENKKLQRLSLQSANSNVLQTQVDSLQWQLRQMESSRQMYRAVMEQVSKFLERVHKNLDIISSKMSTSPKTKTSRFPRSRSVHTMAGTCANSNSGSRCSSPSPTHYSTISISNSSQITNCNVIEQIHELDTSPQDSLNNTFREYTWKPVRPASEHVTLEKLSQESFRFYRTVQSLLNTREPDLIHRLTPAVSEVMIPDSNEKIDNNSVGSCVSLFQNNSVSNRKSLDTSSTCSIQYAITHELENTTTKIDNSCSKPISIEDESGFSSMSSFHDANILPEMKSYPKLGLPIVKCDEPKHKRWNSTPVDKMYDSSNMSVSFCNNNEILQVLWV